MNSSARVKASRQKAKVPSSISFNGVAISNCCPYLGLPLSLPVNLKTVQVHFKLKWKMLPKSQWWFSTFWKLEKRSSINWYNLKDAKRAKMTLQKNATKLDMEMYTSTGETEAGESGIQSQLGLCGKILCQNKTKQQILPKGLAWSKAKILVIRREWCWCKDRHSDQGMLKESHHKCDQKVSLCESECAHMC